MKKRRAHLEVSAEPLDDLVVWCLELDEGILNPRSWAWHEWLWKHDPNDSPLPDVSLNMCSTVGICLAKAAQLSMTEYCGISELLPEDATAATLCISDQSIELFSLRDLTDEVANLQRQWMVQQAWKVDGMSEVVNMLFSRFGYLCCHADTQLVMNDQAQVKSYTTAMDNTDLVCMTQGAIRRILNIFLVFYRSIYIHSRATAVSPETLELPVHLIQRHHVFAGIDDFSGYSMHWDLNPATKLNYIHDFPGLFNSVSQVVYYQNPNYVKRTPKANQTAEIALGQLGALFTFPALMQLFPDVPVLYTDSHIDLATPGQGFRWLMADQHVYMIRDDNSIGWCENIVDLAKLLTF
jgi:hypothetical protein